MGFLQAVGPLIDMLQQRFLSEMNRWSLDALFNVQMVRIQVYRMRACEGNHKHILQLEIYQALLWQIALFQKFSRSFKLNC